jgi:Ser/Thr protein kinase RdoA (MazF antagonist)
LSSLQGRRFVFKITNPGEPSLETELQTCALMHVRQVDPSYPVQEVIRATQQGQAPQVTVREGEQDYVVRLLSYLPGIHSHFLFLSRSRFLKNVELFFSPFILFSIICHT